MTLKFEIRDEDALAFTEYFLRGSPSHQRLRMRVRWVLPCIMIGLLLFTGFSRGFATSSVLIYGGVAILWFVFYPGRFDANIRRHARKQMKESSYEKSLGHYELELDKEGLHSSSPLGTGSYDWLGVDRAELTDDYLFIFLAGSLGYPIRISEIGVDIARAAYELIIAHCSPAKAEQNAAEQPTTRLQSKSK